MDIDVSADLTAAAPKLPEFTPTGETKITYQPLIIVPPVFPERGRPNPPEILKPMPLAARLLPLIPIVGVVIVVVAGAIGGVVIGVITGVLRFLNRFKQAKKEELVNGRKQRLRLRPQPYPAPTPKPYASPANRQARKTPPLAAGQSVPQSSALPLLTMENLGEWIQRVGEALNVDPDVVIDFA